MTGTLAQVLASAAAAISAASPAVRASHDDTYAAIVDLPDAGKVVGPRSVFVTALPSRRPADLSRSCDSRETIMVVTHMRPDRRGALSELLTDADTVLDALEAWARSESIQIDPELGEVTYDSGHLIASRSVRLIWERS